MNGVLATETYTYVGENPLAFSDPDGRCGTICVIGIIGTGWVLYKEWNAISDAMKNMVNRPGADDILNNPNTTCDAQQGQNNALKDIGKV